MGDSFAPFLIFIVIIIVNVIRSQAKREDARRKREADEIRQRRLSQDHEIDIEPRSLYQDAKREQASQPTSGDIFREIFKGLDGGPISDLFREEEKRKIPDSSQAPVSTMLEGQSMSNNYGSINSDMDLEGRSLGKNYGSLGSDNDMEGLSLGKNYGSLASGNDMEGRSISNNYGSMGYDSGKTSHTVIEPTLNKVVDNKRRQQRQSSPGADFNGVFCKNDIIRGIVMAEILGPPRAKKPQVR